MKLKFIGLLVVTTLFWAGCNDDDGNAPYRPTPTGNSTTYFLLESAV